MNAKKAIPLLCIAMALWLLTGCQAITDSLISRLTLTDTKTRLERMSVQVPVPPGAVSVKRVVLPSGGQMTECEGLELQELLGTNNMSFAEVLDFYSSSLQAAGWTLTLARERDRSFQKDDEFSLAISDQYNVAAIGIAAIGEAKSRYRTIYLLELLTPDEVPLPAQCKGG
jgi:hypothetical protein